MEKRVLISIAVPVFNEEDCLPSLYERTTAVMQSLRAYDYEIVFFDDGSTDNSRAVIESLCDKDTHCKAVFFAHNFGYNNTIYYAVQQAKGDCAILLHADLQNPPELIPEFISRWEAGHDVVFGVKNKSKENKLMFFLRTLAYWLLNIIFGMKLIPHATDCELVDSNIIKTLKGVNYSEPFLRALLLKEVKSKALVYYTQDKRAAGKSSFTLAKYYKLTVSWIVFSSKVLPCRFLFLGIVMFFSELLELCIGFLPHLKGLSYLAVSTPLLLRIGLLVFSALICFISILAEFIIAKANPVLPQSTVQEEKRINY